MSLPTNDVSTEAIDRQHHRRRRVNGVAVGASVGIVLLFLTSLFAGAAVPHIQEVPFAGAVYWGWTEGIGDGFRSLRFREAMILLTMVVVPAVFPFLRDARLRLGVACAAVVAPGVMLSTGFKGFAVYVCSPLFALVYTPMMFASSLDGESWEMMWLAAVGHWVMVWGIVAGIEGLSVRRLRAEAPRGFDVIPRDR